MDHDPATQPANGRTLDPSVVQTAGAHGHTVPAGPVGRQRNNMLRLIRFSFFVLIITIGILNTAQISAGLGISDWVPVTTAVILFCVGLLVDLLTPAKKISAITSVFLGIFAGMLATVALGSVVDLLLKTAMDEASWTRLLPYVGIFKVMLGITLCYLGISIVLQTQDDFRLVIPYVEFAKQIRGPKPLLLDSSVLIDGRVLDLVATGLIQAPLVVPSFVVNELQTLADSSDRTRRARGRRGLDLVSRLQRTVLDVTIDETPVPGKAVDQMLVELAKRMPAIILTGDLGLISVAQIQGVDVVGLNKVAEALRPPVFPGESLTVSVVKRGEQPGQGVGYLEDGTMVVLEAGAGRIGEDVTAEVTGSLQTNAGRLIFARLAPMSSAHPGAAEAFAVPLDSPAEPEPSGPPLDAAPRYASPETDSATTTQGAQDPVTPSSAAPSSPPQAPSGPGLRPTRPPVRSITGRNPRR